MNENDQTPEETSAEDPVLEPSAPVAAEDPVIEEPSVTEPQTVEVPAPEVEEPSTDPEEPSPTEASESEPTIVLPEVIPQNVTVDFKVSLPRDEARDQYPPVPLPSEPTDRVLEMIRNLPQINLAGEPKGEFWAQTLQTGMEQATMANVYTKTLEDPEAEFHNTLLLNNETFGPSQIRFRESQNEVYSAESAVLRTMAHMGLGTTWNTPFYNTGMWASFKPPTEEALLELHQLLTSDQIEMGRYSYGLALSNRTAYTAARMAKFAVDHLYTTSLSPDVSTNLLEILRIQDLPSLLWGVACTLYPNGFPYSRACTANMEKCQYVLQENLNIRKLQMVNRRGFTPRQVTMMSKARGSRSTTLESLGLYQTDFPKAGNRKVTVYKDTPREINFILRSPSIAEYIESGQRWIDGMVQSVDAVLGTTASSEDRNRMIDQYANASWVNQYSHWVESISFGSGTITDRLAIESSMAPLSGDTRIRNEFTQGVIDYIESSSVAVVGIPTYVCPKCGKPVDGPETFPFKSNLIPLDVIQLFFILITQKLWAIRNR